jgi:hypothetical protein
MDIMNIMVESYKTKLQLLQEEADRAYAEFIAQGGVVKGIAMGKRSDPAEVKPAWGRRPKSKTKPVVKPAKKPKKV